MSEITILDALKGVVRKHIPLDTLPGQTKRELQRMYSEVLLHSDLHDKRAFGATKDLAKLEELRRTLIKSTKIAMSCEFSTRSRLSGWMGIYRGNMEMDDQSELVNALLVLEQLQRAVCHELDTERKLQPADPRRNWRAVSVANAARTVWAWAEWSANPEKYGDVPKNALLMFGLAGTEFEAMRKRAAEYDQFVANYAPRTVQHNRPSAFGRFLEDVFEALGINGPDGTPVKAATALRSLANVSADPGN